MTYHKGPLARLFALLFVLSVAIPGGWYYRAHSQQLELAQNLEQAKADLVRCAEQPLQAVFPCSKEDAAINEVAKKIKTNAALRKQLWSFLKVVPASIMALYYVIMWVAAGFGMRRIQIVGKELGKV